MKKLIPLFLTVLFVSACTAETVEEPITEPVEEAVDAIEQEVSIDTPDEIVSTVEVVSNIVDFETIAVGDQVGGMEVTDIEIYSFDTSGQADQWNSTITFEGQVELIANYSHSSLEGPFFADMVCVNSIQESMELPVVEDDPRGDRFCFENQDHAKVLLGTEPGDEGTATFVISKYQWVGREGEVVNWATLVEVVE